MSKSTPLMFEVRKKFPGKARKADKGNPRAGIELECICCMGGERKAVIACTNYICGIWPWRKGTGFEQRPKETYPPLPKKKKGNPNLLKNRKQ